MNTFRNEPATDATQPSPTTVTQPSPTPPSPAQDQHEPPGDEDALREEIRHTREDLGATVDELSDRIVTQSQRAVAPLAGVGALIITAMITVSALRKRRQPPRARSRAAARRRRRRR